MASDKYIEMIHMFLDTGINPNIHNSKGHTPLYCAVYAESLELSEKLIENGANPDGIDDETYEVLEDKDDLLYTPLSTACESVNLDIIRLLLESGADPNKNYSGETNISWIIAGNDQPDSIDALKLLLDAGANPNDEDFSPIVELIELLEYYVCENCYWSDNIVDETCVIRAPFDFDSLYYHFKSWCDENDLIGRVKDIQKRSIVKTFVMKIQDESKYGLKLGRKQVDEAINGTKSNLFINFNKKE